MEDDQEGNEDFLEIAKHKLTKEEIQQQKFERELEERSAKEEKQQKMYSRVSDTTVDADQVERKQHHQHHHFEQK